MNERQDGAGTERLTEEEMARILAAHGVAEHAFDLEGTMATVGPDVLWEWHPHGLRIIDRESLRAMYESLFEHFFPCTRRGTTERTRVYGDNFMVIEMVVHLDIDGEWSDGHLASVISFAKDKVISERVYVSGGLIGLVDKCVDETFLALPGVVVLGESSGPG